MRIFPKPIKARKKLIQEFKGKRILDLSCKRFPRRKETQTGKDISQQGLIKDIDYDLTKFPWPIEDNAYDLVLCQHLIEHLPDTTKTMEELNRIIAPGGKIFIETPHYTCYEAYRHYSHCHQFSFGSFDYFIKGNPAYNTDFLPVEKYIYFDDLTFLLGIGFLANLFPRFYEKRLAFIFPATSFQVTFQVNKEIAKEEDKEFFSDLEGSETPEASLTSV